MWKLHKRTLPLLHAWDRAAPADTCVNLIVVWLRRLSAAPLLGDDVGQVHLRPPALAMERA